MRASSSGIGSQLLSACVLVAMASSANAAHKVWDGGTGNWADANWNNDTAAPVVSNTTASNTNDTAEINTGTVTWASAPDFVNNSTVTVGGVANQTATWQQLAGKGSWISIGQTAGNSGTLNIQTGGTFSTGGAGRLFAGRDNATGQINVAGGTLNTTWLVISAGSTVSVSNGGSATLGTLEWNGGSLSVSGGTFTRTGGGMDIDTGRSFSLSDTGTVTIAGQFKPKLAGVASMTGGTLNTTLISFDGTGTAASVFNMGGGTINIANSEFQGIFTAGSADWVDFTGTSGVINLATVTPSQAATLLTTDRIRRNGSLDDSFFTITPYNGSAGATITLVPEPGSLAVLGLAGLLSLRRRRR